MTALLAFAEISGRQYRGADFSRGWRLAMSGDPADCNPDAFSDPAGEQRYARAMDARCTVDIHGLTLA
jgi:hypothetical protein